MPISRGTLMADKRYFSKGGREKWNLMVRWGNRIVHFHGETLIKMVN